MRSYIVSYDLRKAGQNYDGLIKAIKALPDWAKPLESFWLVRTSMTAAELRDCLLPYLDKNDSLLVYETGSDWASWGIPSEVATWLKSSAA